MNPVNIKLEVTKNDKGCFEFGATFQTDIPENLITDQEEEIEKHVGKWEDAVYTDFIPNIFAAIGLTNRNCLTVSLISPICDDIFKARDSLKELFKPRYEEFIYRDMEHSFVERVHQLTVHYVALPGLELDQVASKLMVGKKALSGAKALSRSLFLADIVDGLPKYSILP